MNRQDQPGKIQRGTLSRAMGAVIHGTEVQYPYPTLEEEAAAGF